MIRHLIARHAPSLGGNRVGLVFLACALLLGGCEQGQSPASAPSAPLIDLSALKQAATNGSAQAQRQLGEAYASGHGAALDYKQAAVWLAKAAEQGDANAQYGLAQLYEAGQGVKQSDAEALAWYRKAAEQGHAGAQYGLAVLYAFGRGTPVKDAEAAQWYLKAAEQGEPLAQFNIGQRFQLGRGVPKDPVEACKWFSLAADQVPDSLAARDELKRQLTREQVAEAKRRVDQFKAAGKANPKSAGRSPN
jgi:TPR repeat protein